MTHAVVCHERTVDVERLSVVSIAYSRVPKTPRALQSKMKPLHRQEDRAIQLFSNRSSASAPHPKMQGLLRQPPGCDPSVAHRAQDAETHTFRDIATPQSRQNRREQKLHLRTICPSSRPPAQSRHGAALQKCASPKDLHERRREDTRNRERPSSKASGDANDPALNPRTKRMH